MKKKAYVLINVAAGKLDSAMRTLSGMPKVLSVEGVSGSHDLVAVMCGPDLETLQNTILSTVRGVEGIQSTETWIVMVPQPSTWTQDELDGYVTGCDSNELAAISVLLEKGRSMMIQELIEEIAHRMSDESYDVHNLTVALTGMARRAEDQYRRERFIEFDPDMGYFIDERYVDMLKSSISKL